MKENVAHRYEYILSSPLLLFFLYIVSFLDGSHSAHASTSSIDSPTYPKNPLTTFTFLPRIHHHHHHHNHHSNFVLPRFIPYTRTKLHPHFIDTSSFTKLYSIHEWRDTFLEEENHESLSYQQKQESNVNHVSPKREINVLPFPITQVLLQGQTKEIRLYEDRFIQLFHDCIDNHHSVVAMGLLTNTTLPTKDDSSTSESSSSSKKNHMGLFQSVPLCEIESYSTSLLNQGLGIFCTLRVVGRAQLIQLTQQEPYLKAICTEIVDDWTQVNQDIVMTKKQNKINLSNNDNNNNKSDLPKNATTSIKFYDLANILAANVENDLVTISSLEYKYKLMQGRGDSIMVKENQMTKEEEEDITLWKEVDPAQNTEMIQPEENKEDSGVDEMERRIQEAKLTEQFYLENDEYDDEEEQDDEMDEEEDNALLDHTERFRRAFEVAKSTDTQGYMVSSSIQSINNDNNNYSLRDLTAVSWAAFCTDLDPLESTFYRIQALDCNNVLERLKLANFMLLEKKQKLQLQIKALGDEIDEQKNMNGSMDNTIENQEGGIDDSNFTNDGNNPHFQ